MRSPNTLKRSFMALLFAVVLLGGCAHQYRPGPGWVETGTASWYGEDFHGKPTAQGEPYDMYGVSAAHKTIPLGTRVRVTNLTNCLLYTSPSPRDRTRSRMPSSA